MKDSIRILALGSAMAIIMATAMYFSSKGQELPSTLTKEEISWVEFCRVNGYDIYTDDDDILNEFLDTWVGSAKEEEALMCKDFEG